MTAATRLSFFMPLPPAVPLYGLRGALAFSCGVPATHRLYLDNNNTANQIVRVTGWEE